MIIQITFIIQMDGKDEEDSGLFWLRRVEVMQDGKETTGTLAGVEQKKEGLVSLCSVSWA